VIGILLRERVLETMLGKYIMRESYRDSETESRERKRKREMERESERQRDCD
jgi:hypothetical protein